MKKWMIGFVVVFTCLLTQGVYADSKHMKMYTEPPDVKYEVIGEISHEEPLIDPECSVAFLIGRKLQKKASKLGANALITGKIERFLTVGTKKESYDTDPFLKTYNLSLYLRINATAIKIEKAK